MISLILNDAVSGECSNNYLLFHFKFVNVSINQSISLGKQSNASICKIKTRSVTSTCHQFNKINESFGLINLFQLFVIIFSFFFRAGCLIKSLANENPCFRKSTNCFHCFRMRKKNKHGDVSRETKGNSIP